MDQTVYNVQELIKKAIGILKSILMKEEPIQSNHAWFLDRLPMDYDDVQYLRCLHRIISEKLLTLNDKTTMNQQAECAYTILQYLQPFYKKPTLKASSKEQQIIVNVLESLLISTLNQSQYTAVVLMNILASSTLGLYKLVKLQESDVKLLKQIVSSQQVKTVIWKINKINNSQLSEGLFQEHIERLIEFCEGDFLTMEMQYCYGITTFKGDVILSKKLFDNHEISNIYRDALRIVTLIHEVFAHLKRLRQSDKENVLVRTPPDYKCQASELGFGEIGDFCEEQIYGIILRERHIDEHISKLILDPVNYEREQPIKDLILKAINQQQNTEQESSQGSNLLKQAVLSTPPKKSIPKCHFWYRDNRYY